MNKQDKMIRLEEIREMTAQLELATQSLIEDAGEGEFELFLNNKDISYSTLDPLVDFHSELDWLAEYITESE